MPLIFILIYTLWFLSEILLNGLLRSKENDDRNADKGSLVKIWILIVIANFSAVFILKWFHVPITESALAGYVGIVVIAVGILLRIFIIYSLGKFFTVDVTIRKDHQLKTNGFYRYLRHPSYFAALLSFIGFGVSLNNWISLIIIIFMVLSAFLLRIKVEEEALLEYFGEEYKEYMKRTKKLLPFIY